MQIWTSTLLSILEKTGTENDGDPLNKISQIMELRSISIEKHEWILANMVDQKILAYQKVFMKKLKVVDSWKFWESEN